MKTYLDYKALSPITKTELKQAIDTYLKRGGKITRLKTRKSPAARQLPDRDYSKTYLTHKEYLKRYGI